MPISPIDQTNLVDDLVPALTEMKGLRAIMIPVGVAGEAAKRTEVLVVVGAVIDALYGVAAPTVLP